MGYRNDGIIFGESFYSGVVDEIKRNFCKDLIVWLKEEYLGEILDKGYKNIENVGYFESFLMGKDIQRVRVVFKTSKKLNHKIAGMICT